MFSSTRHRLRYKHGTHQNRDESAGECSSVSPEEGTFILVRQGFPLGRGRVYGKLPRLTRQNGELDLKSQDYNNAIKIT